MGLDCNVSMLLINLRLIDSKSCPDQDRKLEIISLSNYFLENYQFRNWQEISQMARLH